MGEGVEIPSPEVVVTKVVDVIDADVEVIVVEVEEAELTLEVP
jgi:hypothetical protein